MSGNARIGGNSVIDGNARVTDQAEVSDHAFVGGVAVVTDNAQVGGYSQLSDGEVAQPIPTPADPPDPQLVSCGNGHSVSSDQNFCPLCGLPIAAGPQYLRDCPQCGTEGIPDAPFCAACGSSIAIRESSPPPRPLVSTATESAPLEVAVAKKRNAPSLWVIVLVILVPIGITLAIIGFVLTSSTNSGPSLSGLTSSVRAQIAGNGSDSLKVPGVASVVCHPPKSWQTGEPFTCFAYSSSGVRIGVYDGTVEPDSSSGKYQWNASWYSSG